MRLYILEDTRPQWWPGLTGVIYEGRGWADFGHWFAQVSDNADPMSGNVSFLRLPGWAEAALRQGFTQAMPYLSLPAPSAPQGPAAVPLACIASDLYIFASPS